MSSPFGGRSWESCLAVHYLPTSIIVSQSSAGTTDPAAFPPMIPIGAVALVASGAAPTTPTATVVLIGIYAPPLRANCHREALHHGSFGVSGGVHAVIDREVAADEVSAHRSVLTG